MIEASHEGGNTVAKEETERANLYLTRQALDLLAQLAPSPKKRGDYVSRLIVRAAQEAGLIETEPEGNGEVAELRRQQAAINARIDALARQRGQQQGESGSDSPSL
jgi:hypothetical protein